MNLWERIVAAITGEATTIEATLSALEQKLMPGFSALVKKIEATIGAQGITLLEQGLSDIVTAIESGGNISAVIAALIPQVTADVQTDAKQDAATAAHGALELLIAGLPVPVAVTQAVKEDTEANYAPSPAPEPAPDPAPAA